MSKNPLTNLYVQILSAGSVSERLQDEIFAYAKRNHSSPVKVALLKLPELKPDIVEALSKETGAYVVCALLEREVPSEEFLLNLVKTSKQTAVLNSVAKMEGLSDSVYSALAARGNSSVFERIIKNHSIPEGIRFEAVNHFFKANPEELKAKANGGDKFTRLGAKAAATIQGYAESSYAEAEAFKRIFGSRSLAGTIKVSEKFLEFAIAGSITSSEIDGLHSTQFTVTRRFETDTFHPGAQAKDFKARRPGSYKRLFSDRDYQLFDTYADYKNWVEDSPLEAARIVDPYSTACDPSLHNTAPYWRGETYSMRLVNLYAMLQNENLPLEDFQQALEDTPNLNYRPVAAIAFAVRKDPDKLSVLFGVQDTGIYQMDNALSIVDNPQEILKNVFAHRLRNGKPVPNSYLKSEFFSADLVSHLPLESFDGNHFDASYFIKAQSLITEALPDDPEKWKTLESLAGLAKMSLGDMLRAVNSL